MSDIIVLGMPCEAHYCISCGVAYIVPKVVIEKHREQGGFHQCSNGHSQGWSADGSEIGKLRRERDRIKQDNARLAEEAAEAERATQRAKAETARLLKRQAAGVCPCCNRSFVALSRHMKTKHPDFGKANVVRLKAS